jgi:hypothetical protein
LPCLSFSSAASLPYRNGSCREKPLCFARSRSCHPRRRRCRGRVRLAAVGTTT